MTQYIKKLPAVFQTVTEKKFFDATFDQVFSKKDSDLLAGYLGRRDPGRYNPLSDFYLPEPSKNRTWWQLEPTAFARNENTEKTNIFFYDDLLERTEYYGGNTLNQDRLFSSEYYSFGPPIDYDMFVNYHNYYWVEQGLPTIDISGVTGADILGKSSYTTPATATPANFTITTGMRISLIDDPEYSEPHIVENIGNCVGIRLVPKYPDFTAGTIFEFLPWDGRLELSNGRVIDNTLWDGKTWDTQTQPAAGDYITIERGAQDRNAWSRTNKWFHVNAIVDTVNATGTAFPENATRALRPIIQFIADIPLYKSGLTFRSEIKYGFRNNESGSPMRFSQYQGMDLSDVNDILDINMREGDLICFFNDDTQFDFWDMDLWDYPTDVWDAGFGSLNQFIFQVTVLPDGRINFMPYTSWLTPVLDNDIVFILEDGPNDSAQRGQTWYYNEGKWQKAYNDKISLNQPPLFTLYDHNGIELDDKITYPDSTFYGSKIFSYVVNEEPGATVDPVLRFPIVYTALGQASDIVFQNDLIADRYTYGSTDLPINGYYYYKTMYSNVLYNNWNLYTPCECNIVPPPPYNCVNLSKQRVIDKFVVGYGSEYQFRISVTPYGYPSAPDIIVSVNGIEVKDNNYQSNGYSFVEINNSIFVDLTSYITTLLTGTQNQIPVVEIQTYTHGDLDPEAPGYSQIPQQLEANPTQLEVSRLSGSELNRHFSSIISNQPGSTGVSFGGTNNYRDTIKNRSVGSFILQNTAPLLKSMLVSSSNDLDFIAGVRFSNDEYTKFKNRYLSTALQLINQSFSPVRYHAGTVVISLWVNEILKTLNISKEFSNAFAYSYMSASGSPYSSETMSVTDGNTSVVLNDYIDLSNPKNVMYIYDLTDGMTEPLLLIGKDYEIISNNLDIEVQLKLGSGPRKLLFALYKEPLPTYIPSTPTKIGANGVYEPRIELDATYITPTNVIIGHDGSKTIAYNDYRDQLLLELEKRIYNGLQNKYRNQYRVPLKLESVKSGYFRKTRYSREEYLDITESYLNKWSAKNKANYRANDWADASLSPNVVPSFVPGIGNIWKLYNYSKATNANGVPLNLPGNWKGIFQYMYDTIQPDTRPWEMLGFSDKPSWWEYEYGAPTVNMQGQQVWTSTASGNSNMWQDLEAGIIRQGPRAMYDPDTLEPLSQDIWARPGLSMYIPVDSAGEIISVMQLFNVVFSGNYYAPFDYFDIEWMYGDGSPVEQAWMCTSGYSFTCQEILFLTKPAQYGELLWDTVGTEFSPGMISVPTSVEPVMSSKNWQYVQNDVYSGDDPFFNWMRPKNKNQVVHGEKISGEVSVRFGYQRWISDRILFLGADVSSVFGQKIRTLDVNLANKLGGFTNKDTTNTYIEAVSPNSETNTLLIPSTNFDVLLHKSPNVDTYSYSGVVIRGLADGTFAVYGYDLLNSEFTVIDRSNVKLIEVSVGGTPSPFLYFTPGATYNPGDIVRYNGVYYLSLVTQEVQKFIPSGYQKLKGLPTVGGIEVSYKPISLQTTTKVPYGTVFKNEQEVFDFLIGWGAYLESKGWKFDEVNTNTNQLDDWLTSAKHFLFWANTAWTPDSSIQLSPLANKAKLEVSRGYPEDVESLANGVYSILDKFGTAITPSSTSTDREGRVIVVEPNNLASGGIFYLQVNTSETEHILIFDNTTNFNDVVYSPLLRERQQRLRFNGFRSNGWYGKMEAPGYLIIDNQLVPNYDSIVESMRYYYDPNITIDNPSLEDLGRHLIGYESKSYLDNLQVSNDIQYLFYQGAIRQKGTSQAIEKLFRSTKVQSDEIIEIFEEWALKLGDFGNTVEQVSTEFKLTPEQNTGEVIVARLNYVPSSVGFVKQINILNAENKYNRVPTIVISPPDSASDNPALEGIPPRQAKAYAVLDSLGKISRIDITDPGFGYLDAPHVSIDSGSEPNNLDKLYSVWQGKIQKDETLENIINIDIDQTDKWLVRPNDPAYSLEFPVTNKIDYPMPNAGYVNFRDIRWASFDVLQTAVNWGIETFNPVENDTVWIAKNFTEDWAVYKLVNFVSSTYIPDTWKIISSEGGELLLLTDYGQSPYITISTRFGRDADLIPLVNSLGNVTGVNIVSAGTGYELSDKINVWRVIPDNPGYINAELTITSVGIDGEILTIDITNPGSGYDSIENTCIVPEYNKLTDGSRTDFGNMIVIQKSVNGVVNPDDNYTVGIVPYSTTSYTEPGIFTDPDTLISYNAYSIVNLEGVPITADDIGNFAEMTDLLLFKSMRWRNTPREPVLPSYVGLGDLIWVDDVGGKWAVFKISANPGAWDVKIWDPKIINFWSPNYGWDVTGPMYFNLYRTQEALINTSLFQSATVFGAGSNSELVQLPVYDPFKNILPGPAKQNITYMSMQDPARYNVTPDNTLLDDNITFAKKQIGQLWWDLSTARYVYYEQPIATNADGSPAETEIENLTYRRDLWGQIFPGSTVDIYEWVESDVPPTMYAGTGVPRSTDTYVQVVTSNRFTDVTEVKYYFWVLNATDIPNVSNRTMAAQDVSRLLRIPKSQNFAFFAPIQQTGKNNSYMFYNVQEILAYKGDNVQIQYRLAERNDQEHAQWSFFREGDANSVVTDQFWNKMVDSLCGYTKVLPVSDEYSKGIIVANYLPWDIYGWDIAPWDNATQFTIPQYGEILPVPDPSLSEGEKYGIEYRPRQGMFVKLHSARKVFVQAANELLKKIPIRDDNPSWNTGVLSDVYWDYTTWYKTGYENVEPTIIFSTLADANNAMIAGELLTGTIVQVTKGTVDNRFVMYAVVQVNPALPTQSLEEVAVEDSAIMLLESIYTTVNVYGLSVELRQLLNAFRSQIMINANKVDQNSLFFSMLNYVLSEQKNPDWLFKTSYIYVKENNLSVNKDNLYTPSQIDNILSHIKNVKPYHTQIRDYTSSYKISDIAAGTASDKFTINTVLKFGPTDCNGHWDRLCNDVTSPGPWDNTGWDSCCELEHPCNQDNADIDAFTFIDNIEQFIARDDVYTVPLTFFDRSKIGYSTLFPYTFSFDSINTNNPQSIIAPTSVVAIQVGNNILTYGTDYFVEYNIEEANYTAYFYNNPGNTPDPIALVCFNGGGMQRIKFNTCNNELAQGYPLSGAVINVDTRLPVNNISGNTDTLPYEYAPYVGWGQMWEAVSGSVADAIESSNGTAEIPWDAPLVPAILPVSISTKENIMDKQPEGDIYRNADKFAGVLVHDVLAPTQDTENIDVITVSATDDILPEPWDKHGTIWIDGERIEYKSKTRISENTWELRSIRRGTMGTAPTDHYAMVSKVATPSGTNPYVWDLPDANFPTTYEVPSVQIENKVWVEKQNIMPIGSVEKVWNVLTPAEQTIARPPGEYSTVDTSPPLGGLWYSMTSQAEFLKQGPGEGIS